MQQVSSATLLVVLHQACCQYSCTVCSMLMLGLLQLPASI